jgi:hypothetical protein
MEGSLALIEQLIDQPPAGSLTYINATEERREAKTQFFATSGGGSSA